MTSPPEISPREAADQLKANTAIKLLDVREDFEREMACIEGSIQLSEELAEEMVQTWPKDTPIIFHCHHGMRSQSAAGYFMEQGFTQVSNMTGGIDAWSREIDPDIARY